MHELTGHTLVFERRYQADSAIEYAFRRRTQLGLAPSANETPGGRMTRLAKHMGHRTVPQGRLVLRRTYDVEQDGH